MLFHNSIQIYLDWKATHAGTASNRYATRLFHLEKYVGSNKLLADITGDDIIQFHRFLEKTSYTKEKGREQKYSLATIAYSARILKNFFSFWYGRGESKINHKEILPIRYVSKLKKVVSFTDFCKMKDSLRDYFYDDLIKKLVIHLLWDTGMRVSELRDINISDINDTHPTYGIRSAAIRTRKTMRYNLVAWSKETNDLLNRYLGIRLCMDDVKTDALLINHCIDRRRISIRTIERWIENIAKKAGLEEGITPHSFRHGKAHHILNSKGSITDIQAILRHVKPESSFNYLQLNPEQYIATAAKYLVA